MNDVKSVAEINQYVGTSVNPLETPDTVYELYSVPSFDGQYPEIIKGSNIGSTKVTVEAGDVLVCKINPRINRVWVVKHHTEHQLLASSEWIVIRNHDIDSDYLKWYFSSPTFRELLTSQVAGIGGSLTRAQPKQVAKYPVPVPAISVQRHIATVLNKVNDLIILRKQVLAKLDELVKSRFVELFGDIPGEEKVMMADICKIITDGTHQPPQFVKTGIPFLFVSNIVTNEIHYDAEKFISEETYSELIKRTPIEIGDILLSTVGSYGHPAIVKSDKPFCFQRHIAYLKPDATVVNSEYLRGAILSADVQRQIDERVKGIAQKTLNLSEIRKLQLPLPSMEQQEQFAAFVKQTDKSKLAIQQSMDKQEILKKALMQKYFG